jgi:glycosyltransferase involved in cell wall biosynthesis
MVRGSTAAMTTNQSRAAVLRREYGRDVEVVQNVPRVVDPLVPLDPGYPPSRRILLYQGGIYARVRPFAEMIEALTLLPDVDLAILGFGRESNLELIREWAESSDVADRVHLLPPRPFAELSRTAAEADVGIVPLRPTTINQRLGDTNKLFEYLMAGLPVVGSDLPEIRRVLEQGSPPVGEVFDPGSPESIARAVERVLDEGGYDERRAEARRLALERFNWETESKALLGTYAELL